MTEPQEGDVAPDFTLPRNGGGTLSLHHLRGQNVVLYFYPKDDTPGCTKEACEFRDFHPQIEAENAVVVGISPDDVSSHERFAGKYNLPFILVADPNHEAAQAYGVWQERSMYGKKFMGIVRSTFLIDPDGTIVRAWRQVKPEGHAADVLAALR